MLDTVLAVVMVGGAGWQCQKAVMTDVQETNIV